MHHSTAFIITLVCLFIHAQLIILAFILYIGKNIKKYINAIFTLLLFRTFTINFFCLRNTIRINSFFYFLISSCMLPVKCMHSLFYDDIA